MTVSISHILTDAGSSISTVIIHGNELKDRMMQGKCSFAGALQEILSFYDDYAVFVLNAMNNTSGADSFEQHTTASTVKAVENLVLARSRASKLSTEQSVHIYMYISSCLRMCIQWIETGKKIPAAILASHMVSAMPESLRPYLL